MWLRVSELANLIDMSPRTVQAAIKGGKVVARKADGKSYEVDLASLPLDMMARLPEAWRDQATGLTLVEGGNHVDLSPASRAALGRPLTKQERRRSEISSFYHRQDPSMSEAARVAATATTFDVSPSTVRRIVKSVGQQGIFRNDAHPARYANWDPEAVEYLQSWYLSFMKNANVNSKVAAWNAVQAEAAKRGWRIGGRTSAYQILAEIPKLMIKYATGGSRALDNYFYISRDWSKLRPGQIWIGDQHICDFWVVDKSNPEKWTYYRPTIYAWEDGATRCITGLAVDRNYTSDTVLESIRMGIRRFGFFDCTYNDNGSSECAEATVQVIDELLRLSNAKSHMMDISELFRTKDGNYVSEDPDGNVVSIDETVEEWRRKHRRIYANVKNAKAKPIERLFGSIETRMAQNGIPGHVVTPGAPADQEEKEQKLLDWWKKNDMILTLDQFMAELVKGIDEYEHTWHSSLKMTPWQAVQKAIAEGWQAVHPATEDELDFIFLARTRAKVRKGRVVINNIQYIGEDLKTIGGQFADVGLSLHEGETVDIRYSKTDPSVAYAVIPYCANVIRPLRPVEEIDMLDDDAMVNAIRWKRDQMRMVRNVFKSLETPVLKRIETTLTGQVKASIEAASDIIVPLPEPPKAHIPERRKPGQAPSLHASPFDRYRWIIDKQLDGQALDDEEKAYIAEYESAPEYMMQKAYWDNYRRLAEGE